MWLAHYGFHLLTGGLTIVPVTQRAAAIDDLAGPLFGVPLWSSDRHAAGCGISDSGWFDSARYDGLACGRIPGWPNATIRRAPSGLRPAVGCSSSFVWPLPDCGFWRSRWTCAGWGSLDERTRCDVDHVHGATRGHRRERHVEATRSRHGLTSSCVFRSVRACCSSPRRILCACASVATYVDRDRGGSGGDVRPQWSAVPDSVGSDRRRVSHLRSGPTRMRPTMGRRRGSSG